MNKHDSPKVYTPALPTSTSVSCVALYNELRKLINERSGSEFTVYNNEIDCANDPLMRLVLPYTIELLFVADSTTKAWHELSVKDLSNTNSENLARLLAYAFLGRFVTAPADNEARDGSMHLEIDYGDGSLQPRRISCEYQKVLYETVIVGVVALLLVMAALNAVREVRAAVPELHTEAVDNQPAAVPELHTEAADNKQAAVREPRTEAVHNQLYPTQNGCVEWSFRRPGPEYTLRERVARP